LAFGFSFRTRVFTGTALSGMQRMPEQANRVASRRSATVADRRERGKYTAKACASDAAQYRPIRVPDAGIRVSTRDHLPHVGWAS
jgi:hypothetical protein